MSKKLFQPIPATLVADQTSPDRDRVVDGARAISLLIVVAGHAFMGVVAWENGVPLAGNLLAAYPWTQLLTWVFQIVPLFFFAGGAANTISWNKHLQRGGKYSEWIWLRIQRLLRPLWIYLVFMGTLAGILSLFLDTHIAAPMLFLVTQLLWFLGAYVFVTGLTPLFRKATLKVSSFIVVALILVSGLIDLLRFNANWPSAIGLLNFVVVWAMSGYLGSMRAHGTLAHLSISFLFIVLLFGLATNTLLIKFGPWPLSLVGMPGESVTNMAPPSVVLAIHSLSWICVISILNKPITRLLNHRRVWKQITAINLSAMTLYLWHLPVLVLLFALSHLFGLDRPTRLAKTGYPIPDGWGYGFGSLAFWAAFGLGVWAILRALWPLEHMKLPWWDKVVPSVQNGSISPALAVFCSGFGVFLIGASLLVLSATGLGGFPSRIVKYGGITLNSAWAIALLLGSASLVRWAGSRKIYGES